MMVIHEPFITEGGIHFREEEDDGPAVVVQAYDPGELSGTGWFGVRTPMETLVRQGTRRSLSRSHWAMGEIRPGRESLLQGLWVSDVVDQMLEVGRWVHEQLVEEGDVFVIVCEGFVLRMMSQDPNLLAPVRVESVLRDRLRDSKVPYYTQTSSDPLHTITDARLREWCMYRRDSGQHARDAQRHGIHFLRKLASVPKLRTELGL